jgi:hypothetical protein
VVGVSCAEQGGRGEWNGDKGGVVGISCGEECWRGERKDLSGGCILFVGIICAEEWWRGEITGDRGVGMFVGTCWEKGCMAESTIGSGGTTLLVRGLGWGFCWEELETSVSSTELC